MGNPVVTTPYMARELFDDVPVLTKATDVWSLGLTCVEVSSQFFVCDTFLKSRQVIAGVAPFSYRYERAIPAAIIRGETPFLGMPERFGLHPGSNGLMWDFLRRCWNPPNHRPSVHRVSQVFNFALETRPQVPDIAQLQIDST
jgi:serine/threonine protein kinase